MKNLFCVLFISICVLTTHLTAFSQCNAEPCKLILQNGLYKTFRFERTSTFSQDIKTYFQSETFKQDYKNNKWSGGISLIVDAIPIKLAAGSSEVQLNQFQEKVRSATSVQVDQSFYDLALTSIPDVDLAREYTNCVVQACKFGFKLYPQINEKDVAFIINYAKEFEQDAMPRLTSLKVLGSNKVESSVKEGEQIRNNNTVYVDRNPDVDLTLIFETNKGIVSFKVPAEPAGFNKDFPVGTIISSYLNFEQFNAAAQNNFSSPGSIWTSRYSKWAPADGREVSNSKFQLITGQLKVPDMRGVFIRGLNQFDFGSPVVLSDSRKDPESNRVAGSFQPDAVVNHNHTVNDPGHAHAVSSGYSTSSGSKGTPGGELTNGGNGNGNKWVHPAERNVTGITLASYGDAETRPKNVSLYYYIRIN